MSPPVCLRDNARPSTHPRWDWTACQRQRGYPDITNAPKLVTCPRCTPTTTYTRALRTWQNQHLRPA